MTFTWSVGKLLDIVITCPFTCFCSSFCCQNLAQILGKKLDLCNIWLCILLANKADRPYDFALTSWWYIFFADPKLKKLKWLSKFTVINLVFLAWLLEKLYSASLTSMLTVRQLQPTIVDLNQLIRNGDYIG